MDMLPVPLSGPMAALFDQLVYTPLHRATFNRSENWWPDDAGPQFLGLSEEWRKLVLDRIEEYPEIHMFAADDPDDEKSEFLYFIGIDGERNCWDLWHDESYQPLLDAAREHFAPWSWKSKEGKETRSFMLVFFIAALVCVLGLMFDPGDAGWLAWSLFITGFLACAVWNWWRKPLLWRRKCKAFNENLIAAFKAA